ncbi:MAG: zinc-ribbon domain-containing protein [Methanoregula sp.]|nr:zinc-ribbon domain-containing protein [Methanoregula sp.]
MGFPELGSGESVIIQAHNIKVKSVVFEAILTNKRLILVDDKKGLIPHQEILIASIRTIDGGENAIRDPILTFSILTHEGSARQMILTFPRVASGERRRERDDWLKILKEQIFSSENSTVVPDTTEFDQLPSQNPETAPRSYPVSSGAPFQKKKIEISRPRRDIIESAPAMPRPVETTSLPVGLFCSRCGNRVPPESVFCNRCGTPVVSSSEQPADPPAIISATPVAAPSVVPQVQISTPPIFGHGGDRKERTLEEVIHSIEPLIEDSKPRSSEPAPLVPRHYPAPLPAVETPSVVPPTSPQQEEPPAQPSSGEPVPDGASPSTSPPPIPPVPQALPSKKPKFVTIAVLAIVILAVIGGILIFSNSWGTTPGTAVITPAITPIPTVTITTPAPVPSPSPTVTPETTSTPPPQPEVIIPPNGVWVRITYPGKYSGTYGTPGSQSPVGEKNTGDQFYMVSTINGPVEASIQKMDGSSNMLAIEVYKNGELMKRATTVSPKGIIEFQVDLKPTPAPTPVPTQTVSPTSTPAGTAALNSTVNSTGTA